MLILHELVVILETLCTKKNGFNFKLRRSFLLILSEHNLGAVFSSLSKVWGQNSIFRFFVIFNAIYYLINNFPELPIFFITHSNDQKTILYSRKFSSAKNFVNSDRQAVRQEYIFVKRRSSLVCSSLIQLSLFCLSFISHL